MSLPYPITRLVGVCAFSGSFLGLGWFHQSGVVSSHQPVTRTFRAASVTQRLFPSHKLLSHRLPNLSVWNNFIRYSQSVRMAIAEEHVLVVEQL